jgi:hypothetical protein
MIKVIIAGGRDFTNEELLKEHCDSILIGPDFEIVSGTARGADRLGEFYAMERNLPIRRFQPDWDKFGKRAGYLRNEEMAAYADLLIAFWDERSRGTKHMIDIATTQGLKIHVVKY